MRIVAIVNPKGGVAKSTIGFHLAHAGLEASLRVLVGDFDRHGSMSVSFPSTGASEEGLSASELFSSSALTRAPEVVMERLSIIRADETLSQLTSANADVFKRPARHLRTLAADYDLCIIDTPGAIGFNPPMTLAALVAADAVLCPFSVGLYEAKALNELWDFVRKAKQTENPRLRLMGLLPSRINTKSKEQLAAIEDLRRKFGSAMLPGMLSANEAVNQAVMNRRPVWRATKGAGHLKAAREWRAVCDMLLGNLLGVK